MATQQEIKEVVSALKDILRDSKYGYSEENIGVLVKQLTAALKNTDSKDIEKIFKEIIPREDIWDKVQEISDARRIDRKEVVQESKAETPKGKNVDWIDELADNEIFVFGSNRKGIHGKGAALDAKNKFGAQEGVGEGLTGKSYALPTKATPNKSLSLEEISKHIDTFLKFAAENPNKTFKMTAIGTNLAGFEPKQIANILFSKNIPGNVDVPSSLSNAKSSFEVSTKGNQLGKEFSALNATFKEGKYAGKTIEEVWQNDIKKSGKGKPPSPDSILFGKPIEESKRIYQQLWQEWANENPDKIKELKKIVDQGTKLTDSFAGNPDKTVNQAEALTNVIKNTKSNIETPDEILDDNKRFSQYDDVDMKLLADQNAPSNTPKLTTGVINPADKHNLEYIVKNFKNIDSKADRRAWVGKQPQYIQDLANKYKMSYIAKQMGLGKTVDKPLTEATNVSPENVNNAKVVRKPLTSDFELGIPNYGKKIPDNTVKVWNLGRKIFEQDIDVTKLVDGKPAVSGWEPNLIGTGHQEGILIDKSLMEAEWLDYGKEVPKPGERIVHGFDGNARRNIKNLKGGIEWNYGIATEVIEVEELVGDWFNDIEIRNKIARQMGITPQALEKLVISGKTGAEQSQRAGFYVDKWSDAYFVKVKPLTEKDITDKWINAEEGINVKATSVEAAARSWGFDAAKNIELDTLLKGVIPLMGAGLKKGAKVLDYGEVIYGWMANGIGGVLNKLGTPGKAVAKVVGQGAKKGTATLTAAGAGVTKSTAAKVGVKAGLGATAASGSVTAMAAYEKANFYYGIASGIILSAIETLGIITKDTFGEMSIKNALGPEYEKWAESNGIIDKIGVYPLINSLELAEEQGILSPGFVDEYTNWTNDKWINVIYEFLGTEGYEDMESVNTVWREKRAPQNWFGSLNDVFGLNSGTALMNAGFIPETGLMPAIKRSPIITGIEIPFENWLLPKVGLEDWVYPEDDYSDETQLIEDFNSYGDITPVDNNAWLGNMSSIGDADE